MPSRVDIARPSRLRPIPNTPHGHSELPGDAPPALPLPKDELLFSFHRESLENSSSLRGSTGSFPLGALPSPSPYLPTKSTSLPGAATIFGIRSSSSNMGMGLPYAVEQEEDLTVAGRRGKRAKKKTHEKSPDQDPVGEPPYYPSSDINPTRRSKTKGKSREGGGKGMSPGVHPAPTRNKTATTTISIREKSGRGRGRGGGKEEEDDDEQEGRMTVVVERGKTVVQGGGVRRKKKMPIEGKGERNTDSSAGVEEKYPSLDVYQHDGSTSTANDNNAKGVKMDTPSVLRHTPTTIRTAPSLSTTDALSAANKSSLREGGEHRRREKQASPSGSFPTSSFTALGQNHSLLSQNTSQDGTQRKQRAARSRTKEKTGEMNEHLGKGTYGYLAGSKKSATTASPSVSETQKPAPSTSQGSSSLGVPLHQYAENKDPIRYAPTSRHHAPIQEKSSPTRSNPHLYATTSSENGQEKVVFTSSSTTVHGAGKEATSGVSVEYKAGKYSVLPSSSPVSSSTVGKEVGKDRTTTMTESFRLEAHKRSAAVSSIAAGNWRAKQRLALPSEVNSRSSTTNDTAVKLAASPSVTSSSHSSLGRKKRKMAPNTQESHMKETQKDDEETCEVREEALPEGLTKVSYSNPTSWDKHLSDAVVKMLSGRELEAPYTTHLWKQAYPHPETEIDAQDEYDAYCEREEEVTSSTAVQKKENEGHQRRVPKPLSNPHIHQYDRKLRNGYYACIRCKAPICSPKFQVRHEEKGVAVFQYLNPDAVRVEVDIFGSASFSPFVFSSSSASLARRQGACYPSHFFMNATANRLTSSTSSSSIPTNASRKGSEGGTGHRTAEPPERRVDPFHPHMWSSNTQIHCLAFCTYCNGCLGICTLDVPVSMLDRVESGELFYVNSCCLVYQPYRTTANLKGTIVGDIAGEDHNSVNRNANSTNRFPLFEAPGETLMTSPRQTLLLSHRGPPLEDIDEWTIVEEEDFGLGIEDFESDDGEGPRKPEMEFPSDSDEFWLRDGRETSAPSS